MQCAAVRALPPCVPHVATGYTSLGGNFTHPRTSRTHATAYKRGRPCPFRLSQAAAAHAADTVMVSPSRRPPMPPRAATDAPSPTSHLSRGQNHDAEDGNEDDDDGPPGQPPRECSAAQRRVGEWMRQRLRCPAALLDWFYLLKLQTWIVLLVRRARLACSRRLSCAAAVVDRQTWHDHQQSVAAAHLSRGAGCYRALRR